jgi:phage baseplate assembly protein W
MRIVHAVGVLPGGGRVPLPPRITSDNPEVLQSMATIWRAVRGGPSRRRRFCRKLARRVSQAQGRPLRSVTRVELATSHFDAIEYFEHGPEPLSRNIHARCEVP